jgi:uncharacterized membrane protein YkvA (DUF1232 family)
LVPATTETTSLLILAFAALALYAIAVATLLLLGRRRGARALAGFVPDCVVLFRRLLGDERISRPRRLLVAALLLYLASPLDLVPDFIPVAGQLDDVALVALALRVVVRGGGADLVREHWPGPPQSLAVILRFAGLGFRNDGGTPITSRGDRCGS